MADQVTEIVPAAPVQEPIHKSMITESPAAAAGTGVYGSSNATINTVIQRVSSGNQSPLQCQKDAMYLQRTIGNRAVTQLMKGLQKRDAGGEDTGAIHQAAAVGVSGTGSQLPHYEKIQSSFGKHDVSSVQAYTNTSAQAASRSIGAEAYTTGNKVAFNSSTPSLHTTAHEAAHTLQQQAGVSLKGGVGAVGDSYERHADAVADKVVRGESAEGLISEMANVAPNASSASAGSVQRMRNREGLFVIFPSNLTPQDAQAILEDRHAYYTYPTEPEIAQLQQIAYPRIRDRDEDIIDSLDLYGVTSINASSGGGKEPRVRTNRRERDQRAIFPWRKSPTVKQHRKMRKEKRDQDKEDEERAMLGPQLSSLFLTPRKPGAKVFVVDADSGEIQEGTIIDQIETTGEFLYRVAVSGNEILAELSQLVIPISGEGEAWPSSSAIAQLGNQDIPVVAQLQSDDPQVLAIRDAVMRDLDKLVNRSINTVQVASQLDAIGQYYHLNYIRMEGIEDTGEPRIVFGVNPDFEYSLSGTQLEMRMQGSQTGSKFNTKVKWLGDNINVGGTNFLVSQAMHAFPLSQDHGAGSDTGANPTASHRADSHSGLMSNLPTGGQLGNHDKDKNYIRGHLLNANLGGPAIDKNFFPITGKANGQHSANAEEFIKKSMDKGYVYEYTVNIKNIRNINSIAATGLYSVDSDLEFEFARLDVNLQVVANTRHKGTIKSEFKGMHPDPFVNKSAEFSGDFGKSSAGKSTANKPIGAGGESTFTVTGRKKPESSTLNHSITAAPLSGFTLADPGVGNFGDISLTATGAQTLLFSSAPPKPTTTTTRLSLYKSADAHIVTYFQSLVTGWSTASIQNWIANLRLSGFSKWSQIENLAHTTFNLNSTIAKTILNGGYFKLIKVTINGAA